MLPGGADLLYRRVLAAPHHDYARVEVWSGQGVRLDTGVPGMLRSRWLADGEDGLVFLSGSVSATLNNRVARNLTLTVPFYMYPDDPSDLLAPFGNELRVYVGITLGDGSTQYSWQVFRGRIRDVQQSSDGTCTVQCSDRATDIQDVNFISPENSNTGNTISEEFQRLIIDAVPNATFGASDDFSKLMQPVTWEFERAAALDEMARSVGALWYPLANGDFVLRRFPWTVSAPPVITVTDQQGGTVNAWMVRRSRDSIFNVVTLTGERLNGDDPVYATASDITVGSPTNVAGNFGIKSRQERLQQPSTQGGASATAEELLRTYIAPVEEWTLIAVPDASLELGDVLRVQVNGRDVIQVVTGFALPIGLAGDMTISTRSLVIGGEF